MVYGILLLFYERYSESAIGEFKQLLTSVDPSCELIIVSNNPDLRVEGVNLVYGENFNSEFSGFDAGIKKINEISPDDFVIFANDTFCHHRRWGNFEKKIFKNAFQVSLKESFQGIVGEVDTFRENFCIMGCISSKWVSTYLFGMSCSLILNLKQQLFLRELTGPNLIYPGEEGSIVWGDGVSQNLRIQLTNWVADTNRHGWYKKGVSNGVKIIKLQAILNEMYLSAFALNRGYVLRDVYSNLGFLQSMFFKLIRIHRYFKGYF